MNKVIFITGASSGIGKATAIKLTSQGHIVYGSVRDLNDLKDHKDIKPIVLDMTDYKSLEQAVDRIIKAEGRIDVLFNNAGYGLYGTVEETSINDAKKQFEVNLFGLARLTQLVLPHMRANGSGTIINTSSMGGRIYTPLGAWYHATKHALEGWSDCLRLELKQFNIKVIIIEPGVIKTPWGGIAADNIQRTSEKGPYADFAKKTAQNMRKTYDPNNSISNPEVVAGAVAKAINSNRPKTRYVTGKYARTLMFIRKYLGDRVFDYLILRAS
jgi:NAD(P)-dependent dehydrogenase (short-subunit alcohol dehydrogenase family)